MKCGHRFCLVFLIGSSAHSSKQNNKSPCPLQHKLRERELVHVNFPPKLNIKKQSTSPSTKIIVEVHICLWLHFSQIERDRRKKNKIHITVNLYRQFSISNVSSVYWPEVQKLFCFTAFIKFLFFLWSESAVLLDVQHKSTSSSALWTLTSSSLIFTLQLPALFPTPNSPRSGWW